MQSIKIYLGNHCWAKKKRLNYSIDGREHNFALHRDPLCTCDCTVLIFNFFFFNFGTCSFLTMNILHLEKKITQMKTIIFCKIKYAELKERYEKEEKKIHIWLLVLWFIPTYQAHIFLSPPYLLMVCKVFQVNFSPFPFLQRFFLSLAYLPRKLSFMCTTRA